MKQQTIITAEKYLHGIGTREHHVRPMVEWAKRRGMEHATTQQWKSFFSDYVGSAPRV